MVIRLDSNNTPFENESPTKEDLNETFAYVEGQFFVDNTGGSVSSSAVETDLATTTVTAGAVGTNGTLDITAPFYVSDNNATSSNFTFRLYVDGIVKKTIVFTTGGASDGKDMGSAFQYVETGVDNTAAVIVKVTAQSNNAVSNAAFCTGLTVRGYNR